MKEYHISECCKAELFFKGAGKGFWCSNCKKEITRTIVAFNDKEKKENSAMNKAINNIRLEERLMRL